LIDDDFYFGSDVSSELQPGHDRSLSASIKRLSFMAGEPGLFEIERWPVLE